ncbi:n-acetylglucosaminyl transferase component gpi1 [Pyrrhoderma noxium]|uniref:N-acetylglucosaminyl transferase component gpi1 n=1 Tax=Pyrrhoderma noxium TaxID=2282107 RepID=A0A286US00_9AGAM|nr:n-acetylglucosaminyl transferase component gpi1 [Pyrrhoderma noxium]
MTCVFWPEDFTQPGTIVGWRAGSVVIVAGTIYASDDIFRASLEILNKKSIDESPVGEHLDLEILGECLKGASYVELPSVVKWSNHLGLNTQNERPTIMYYHRPKARTGRYYTLTEIDLDILMAIQGSEERSTRKLQNNKTQIAQKFSCKKPIKDGGINSLVLKKMNVAHKYMASLGGLLEGSTNGSRKSGISAFFVPVLLSVHVSAFHWAYLARDKLLSLFELIPWIQSTFAFAQQVDLRCEQIVFILQQIRHIIYVEERSENIASARYISTQNCIWLILNDIIIGSAVGMFILENRIYLSILLRDLSTHYMIGVFRQAIFWLDNWPAGLKLNSELSRFLYLILHAVLNLWEDVLLRFIEMFPKAIVIVGVSGIFGLSMILALLSDLTSLMSVHITLAYRLIRIGYRSQLLLAKSLFNLFRGKRYNVLRKRLDDWDYDLDQLILGTMLFTLISFLFPTISVYYILFAMARAALLLLRASFEVASALLNHFPLFALMLRVKDPWRLPGGIILRPYRRNRDSPSTFLVQSVPIKISKILNQYAVLGSQLASYYAPWRLLGKFVSGNQLDPIPQSLIRYTYGTQSIKEGQ